MLRTLIAGFIAGKKVELALFARRSAMMGVAAVFLLIGGVFLTIALWIALAYYAGAFVASAVFAALFMLLGVIIYAQARRLEHRAKLQAAAAEQAVVHAEAQVGAARPAAGGMVPSLIEAFLVGLLSSSTRK